MKVSTLLQIVWHDAQKVTSSVYHQYSSARPRSYQGHTIF